VKVFVLDNYDSFTFNLVQYLGELGAELDVARNDSLSVHAMDDRAPDAVVISPGPGVPADAGISIPLVDWCAASGTPLLGVCLGHQAIAVAFGGTIVPAPEVVHGKTSQIHHSGAGVFERLPNPFEATRYHSLVVAPGSVPPVLDVTASTSDGVIMGVKHKALPIEGVQFHPESILTGVGMELLQNFLARPRV
jgi:anthranilate synthase/aminodeoxychorismate synthase-like glutamine amidotransferase